jgi:hypothetical protein
MRLLLCEHGKPAGTFGSLLSPVASVANALAQGSRKCVSVPLPSERGEVTCKMAARVLRRDVLPTQNLWCPHKTFGRRVANKVQSRSKHDEPQWTELAQKDTRRMERGHSGVVVSHKSCCSAHHREGAVGIQTEVGEPRPLLDGCEGRHGVPLACNTTPEKIGSKTTAGNRR